MTTSGSINFREKQKTEAAQLGIPLKKYRASLYASVGLGYAVEVIRRRCKKSGVECTITPSDLAELWALQEGRCPLTGWKLERRLSGSGLVKTTMSVDRINPEKGYTRRNVRLVSFMANNARYKYRDYELLAFCRAVVEQERQKNE